MKPEGTNGRFWHIASFLLRSGIWPLSCIADFGKRTDLQIYGFRLKSLSPLGGRARVEEASS
jgi:hypothetical protein